MNFARLKSSVLCACLLAIPVLCFCDELTVQIKTEPEGNKLPFEVNFIAEASGGISPYYFTWNFGDGRSSTLNKINHFYRELGRYTVKLYVFDESGSEARASKDINIIGRSSAFDQETLMVEHYTDTSKVHIILGDINNENILWLGTNGGLIKHNTNNSVQQIFLSEFPGSYIKDLIQDNDGNLWFSTQNSKSDNEGRVLVRFVQNLQEWKIYSKDNSTLPHNNINDLFLAKDGLLWIATDNGIASYSNTSDKWFSYPNSLEKEVVKIYELSNGDLLATSANDNALFFSISNSDWEYWEHAPHTNIVQFNNGDFLYCIDEELDFYIPIPIIYKWNYQSGKYICDRIDLREIDNDFFFGGLSYHLHFCNNNVVIVDSVLTLANHFKGSGYVISVIDSNSFTIISQELFYLHSINFFESDDCNLWIGTSNGLIRYNCLLNKQFIYDNLNGFPFFNVLSFLKDENGTIFISVNDTLHDESFLYNISLRDDDNLVINARYLLNQKMSNQINTIKQVKNEDIWFATDKGLIVYTPNNNNMKNCRNVYNKNSIYQINEKESSIPFGTDWSPEIYSLEEMNDGEFFATDYNGILKYSYDTDQWAVINQCNTNMPALQMHKMIYLDNTFFMAATDIGLIQFQLEVVPSIYVKNLQRIIFNSKCNNSVLSLIQTRNKDFWLGTHDGLLQIKYQDFQNNLERQGFQNICADECISSYKNFLSVWTSVFEKYTICEASYTNIEDEYYYISKDIFDSNNSKLPTNQVNTLHQSSDGKIWVGTSEGLANYNNDQKLWTVYDHIATLESNNINAIFQTIDDSIWVGTTKGLARLNPDTNEWNIIEQGNNDFSNYNITCLLQANNGDIWVGTKGSGALKLKMQNTVDSPGKLILIAGGDASEKNELWETTEHLCKTIYRVFTNRTFKNSDIYFISPKSWFDINIDGFNDHVVDCPRQDDQPISLDNIEYAITDWATLERTQKGNLFLYLVGHGFPLDNSNENASFQITSKVKLYADQLNQWINDYEVKTKEENNIGHVFVIIEACYAGNFIKDLEKEGRTIISATDNHIARYTERGIQSFSQYFIQKLSANKTIEEAFCYSKERLKQFSKTSDQRPQLIDPFDISRKTKIGDDTVHASPWPEILSVEKSDIIQNSISFTVTTNISATYVWASVLSPVDITTTRKSDQKINDQRFQLFSKNSSYQFSNTYEKLDTSGIYEFTFWANDRLGNIDVFDPIRVYITDENHGFIEGTLSFELEGVDISFDYQNIDISILDIDHHTKTYVNSDGSFSIFDVLPGTYRIKISPPHFAPYIVSNVDVIKDKQTQLNQIPVELTPSCNNFVCDPDCDEKVSLKDVIIFLQKLTETNSI